MKSVLFIWNRVEELCATILFFAMIIFGLFQVISRFGIISIPLDWTEELSRYAFIALVYISASLAIAHRRHVRVEVIDNYVKGKAKITLDFIVNIGWALFNLVIAYQGYIVAKDSLGTTSPVLEYDLGYIYMIIPIMFLLMAIRVFVIIFEDMSKLSQSSIVSQDKE